jgi:long-chain acyl-CoA synthetase
MSIQTLADLLLVVAGRTKPDCLMHKVGGKFVPISTAELIDQVRGLAKALQDLGVGRGDRVAQMAENGPHWPTVDFAVLAIGAVHVPIYPTLLPEQAAYIVQDSGAKVVLAHGLERLTGLLERRAEMPSVQHFVAIGCEPPPGVHGFVDLIEGGRGWDQETLAAQCKLSKPEDLATLIYTSGTTGNPKGVMLSHGNIASNVVNALQRLDIEGSYTALSFLPLAHSFERTVDYIYFYRGCTIAYAESVQAVAQNLGEVRPQVFVSVPRVYEKVLARVQENVAKSSPTKQKIFRWAVGVGKEALPWRLRKASPPGLLGLKTHLADKLVFAKIRERLGGRFQMAVSGGAPLGRDVAEFFWGAGVPIYEGYGLTETSPVLTVNAHDAVKMGTVGKAIPGVELRIAEDGEILARGPNIMRGYFNNPTATAEVIDSQGWFHTGDIGQLDGEGFLTITDRKKELIVNAYGKNIAPAPIENLLKSDPLIGQAVVIGDKRPFCVALLVPEFEGLRSWAQRQGLAATDDAKLVREAKVVAHFSSAVERANADLARFEQIRAFEILPVEFTLETGELTPTQKVKRRVILKKYAEAIDDLYRRHEAG